MKRLASLVGIHATVSNDSSAGEMEGSASSSDNSFDNSIEDYLARMAHESTLGSDLKIDRPLGIVVFKKLRMLDSAASAATATADSSSTSAAAAAAAVSVASQEVDALEKWSTDINSILKLVETTCHLIRREYVIHKVTDV